MKNLFARQYPQDYFSSLDTPMPDFTTGQIMVLGIIVLGVVAVVALVTFNKRK